MHKNLAEAALFMATRPLGLDELGKIMGINSMGFVKQVMEALQEKYSDSGIDVVNTPDGWVMQVKSEFLPKVAHLTPYHDLSEGTKRTLALVVYKEPIKQSDIIKTQGNKAYTYVKDLHRKGLIKAEKDGRTKSLYLTPEFERYFGEERKKVKDKMDVQVQQLVQEKTIQQAQQPQEVQAESVVEIPKQVIQNVSAPEEPIPQPEEPVSKPEAPEQPSPETEEPIENKVLKEGIVEEPEMEEQVKKSKNGKQVIETGEIKFEDLKKKTKK